MFSQINKQWDIKTYLRLSHPNDETRFEIINTVTLIRREILSRWWHINIHKKVNAHWISIKPIHNQSCRYAYTHNVRQRLQIIANAIFNLSDGQPFYESKLRHRYLRINLRITISYLGWYQIYYKFSIFR